MLTNIDISTPDMNSIQKTGRSNYRRKWRFANSNKAPARAKKSADRGSLLILSETLRLFDRGKK
jgi:hypothetical protein